MNPGKKNSNLLKNTGIHFLEFALGFLSLAKCLSYQPGCRACFIVSSQRYYNEWIAFMRFFS